LIQQASKGSLPSGFDSTNQFIIIYGVSVGMMLLHSHNLLHHDLKPFNIFLDDDFEPKISGFTFSEFFDPKSTITSSWCGGTLPYMAPEMLEQEPHGLPVDVYAFAISVYQIVTWREPYPCITSELRLQRNVVVGQRPSLDDSVSPGYKDLMEQCWHHDPNTRPTFADIVRGLGSDLSEFGAIDESRFRAYQKKVLPSDFK
jgi:serine/threonine protein kinase